MNMTNMEQIFGGCISSYTRKQAIEDGVLIDVSQTADEAGFKWPVAVTSAVHDRYIMVPDELVDQQNAGGRLWDILWMLWVTIRTGKISGDQGEFKLLVRFPAFAEWQGNETNHAEDPALRLVVLKSVCGPGDDGAACITVMMPFED